MSIVLKISKPNREVTSNNPDDFLLQSNFPQLQVFKTGTFSKTFTGGDRFTVDHDLGYKPFCLGYMQRFDGLANGGAGDIDTDFHLLDWSVIGATYLHYSRLEIEKDQIHFFMTDTNLIFATLKGYYIIFKNPIDEVFS